jgi:hypothetical protein
MPPSIFDESGSTIDPEPDGKMLPVVPPETAGLGGRVSA